MRFKEFLKEDECFNPGDKVKVKTEFDAKGGGRQHPKICQIYPTEVLSVDHDDGKFVYFQTQTGTQWWVRRDVLVSSILTKSEMDREFMQSLSSKKLKESEDDKPTPDEVSDAVEAAIKLYEENINQQVEDGEFNLMGSVAVDRADDEPIWYNAKTKEFVIKVQDHNWKHNDDGVWVSVKNNVAHFSMHEPPHFAGQTLAKMAGDNPVIQAKIKERAGSFEPLNMDEY